MGYTQSGKEMSTHGTDMLSTPWVNRGDLAFCQPHGSYVTFTPWGRVQQKCALRYVHPMGPGTAGESVNSMGPGTGEGVISMGPGTGESVNSIKCQLHGSWQSTC